MKVLFAVSNDNITKGVISKYQRKYKEIITSKNVYYFNAIVNELQRDKSYDSIIISEDLEPISNNNFEAIDNFLVEKLDNISDEASKANGIDIPIIFICSDRRTKNDELLRKLFSMSIYNALIGNDRNLDSLCNILNKPRSKKEAKKYYNIENDDEIQYSPSSNDLVSEDQIKSILNYYGKIGNNEKKCVEAFDSIANQYDDTQLRIIVKFLPMSVKAILETSSMKYQMLMSNGTVLSNGKYVQYDKDKKSKIEQPDFMEKDLKKTTMTQPVIIPSAMNINNPQPNVVRPAVIQPQPAMAQAQSPVMGGQPSQVVRPQPIMQNHQPNVQQLNVQQLNVQQPNVQQLKPAMGPMQQPVMSQPQPVRQPQFGMNNQPQMAQPQRPIMQQPIVPQNTVVQSQPVIPQNHIQQPAVGPMQQPVMNQPQPSAIPERPQPIGAQQPNINSQPTIGQVQQPIMNNNQPEPVHEPIIETETTEQPVEENVASTSSNEHGYVLNELGEVEIPKKRGRGRPRKYPISTEPKIKRGRGRPRKNPIENAETIKPVNEVTENNNINNNIQEPVDDVLQPINIVEEPINNVVEPINNTQPVNNMENVALDTTENTNTANNNDLNLFDIDLNDNKNQTNPIEQNNNMNNNMNNNVNMNNSNGVNANNTQANINPYDSFNNYDMNRTSNIPENLATVQTNQSSDMEANTEENVARAYLDEMGFDDMLYDETLKNNNVTDNQPLENLNDINIAMSNQQNNNQINEIPNQNVNSNANNDFDPFSSMQNELFDNSLINQGASVVKPMDNIAKKGKVVSFVGTTKNGISFVVNNLAQMMSDNNIKTAIIDLTTNKNDYYMFTNNDARLMKKCGESMQNLANGVEDGIQYSKNLTIYTSVPGESELKDIDESSVIENAIKFYDVIILDCDYNTNVRYFELSNEIYLVQSMDAFTIQPLTKFLSDLKEKKVLDESKLRVVINKYVKLRRLDFNMIIGGMSKYNEPSMTLQRDLFNPKAIKYALIPFEERAYAKYLEEIAICQMSLNGFSREMLSAFDQLKNMVYPLVAGSGIQNNNMQPQNFQNAGMMNTTMPQEKKKKSFFWKKSQDTQPVTQSQPETFSNDVNDTLNKMRNNF